LPTYGSPVRTSFTSSRVAPGHRPILFASASPLHHPGARRRTSARPRRRPRQPHGERSLPPSRVRGGAAVC
jgi:hypothetical protein